MKHAIHGYYANNPHKRENIIDFLIKSGVVTDGTPKRDPMDFVGGLLILLAGTLLVAALSLIPLL